MVVEGSADRMALRDIDDELNRLSHDVIGAAIEVHRELGPGLLERTYRLCLASVLEERGHRVAQEVALPVTFRGRRIEQGLRIDLVIDEALVLELKTVPAFHHAHDAQLMTYLRAGGFKLGLLLNFNTFPLSIRRLVSTKS